MEDTNHDVRLYDSPEYYITQCKKCHKLGHTTYECKLKFLCPWCSKSDCYKKCDQKNRKCANCDGDHTQWTQGRPEDVLWTSILDKGTSQSDVPWTGKMYLITSVPNGRLRTSKLDLVWTSYGP